MRKRLAAALAVSLLTTAAGIPAFAVDGFEETRLPAPEVPAPEAVGAEKRVSIDLRDSELVDVLKFLAQKSGINIFISRQIQGRVTLYLKDVRVKDILDIILLSNNLAHYNPSENIVYVLTQEEYKARFGEEYGDPRKIEWLRLKYAAPSQIFNMLEPTKSKIGSIVMDEQSGTVILMDMPDKVRFMMEVIRELDQPLETKVFDLNYSKAADIQTLLTAQIEAKGVASVHSDARSNQVVVTALPVRMKEIEKLIENVDRKTREVTIDAQIVKITLSKDFHRGIDWNYVFNEGLLEPLSIDMQFPSATATATATSVGTIRYATGPSGAGGALDLVLRFLETMGESKILASPRITVVEGEDAKILIGTREAYVTSATTTGSSTATSSESINFIDVGISLTVSATINKKGYVTIKVRPEVSNVDRTLTTASGNLIPIVATTTAETRVMVKDGTTIVLGGLRKDEKTLTQNQLPGFSKLPVMGDLFKSDDTTLEQTELIVFLTPHIYDGDGSTEFDTKPKGPQPYPSAALPAAAVPAANQNPATA